MPDIEGGKGGTQGEKFSRFYGVGLPLNDANGREIFCQGNVVRAK